MTTTTRQGFFVVFAIIGVCATWYFNIKFMNEFGGFSWTQFIADAHANSASSSISNDLLVVVATFLFWSYYESKRLAMRFWWLYVALTFVVAIAFTFPLFMFMRERALAKRNEA